MDAIVYESHTGHSKQYAELLGKKLNLPVYSLKDAKKSLSVNAEIIFFGWLMAGNASGYDKAHKRYNVRALCAVGMCADTNNKQLTDLEKKYRIDHGDIFYLPGGFEQDKLRGIYKFMMSGMKNMMQSLENKGELSESEKQTLEMYKSGGNIVSEENLAPVILWYEKTVR